MTEQERREVAYEHRGEVVGEPMAIEPKFFREFTGAIVYCCICCTNDDASNWGWNDMVCNNCSTRYKVFVDPEIVASHAMNG